MSEDEIMCTNLSLGGKALGSAQKNKQPWLWREHGSVCSGGRVGSGLKSSVTVPSGVAMWQQLGNTCLQNEGSSCCWVLDQLHLPKEALVKALLILGLPMP